MIANSIACAYLVLSLPLSIFHLIKSGPKISRIMLVSFDTVWPLVLCRVLFLDLMTTCNELTFNLTKVMLALLAAGASAAASTVYLAHKGNAKANWFSVCQQFNNFCERISGSLIGSFFVAVVLILIIITSAVALSRR